MGGWRQQGKGNAGSRTQRRMERAPAPIAAEAPEYGSHSLEAAARFAVSVLRAQVAGQGAYDAKLAYTALKYLEQNLAAAAGTEPAKDRMPSKEPS